MEHKQGQKHFDEEEVLNKVEHTIDQKMDKLMQKPFAQKFITLPWMKKILTCKSVRDINIKLQPYLKIIFAVIGWISLIAGIIGVFSFLVSLSGIGFMFSLGFWVGLRVLIYILLALGFALVSLLTGFGLLTHKKWLIPVAVLGLFISVATFVISFIPVGLYSYTSYGTFGGSLFNLAITFVVLILILVNERLFNK